MRVMLVLAFVLLAVACWAQPTPTPPPITAGCTCNNATNTCNCCAGAPSFPIFSACATLVWQPAQQNIAAALSIANNPVFGANFNKTNDKACYNLSSTNPPATACFLLANYFIFPTGACGEFEVQINFIIGFQFPLGVFALGNTTGLQCPPNPYPPIPPPPNSALAAFYAEKRKYALTKLFNQLQRAREDE